MNRFKILVAALTVSAFLYTQQRSVFAWNSTGHRIIAYITYDQLDPSVRQAMVELLKQHPRFEKDFQGKMPDVIKEHDAATQNRWIFMHAATWPDITRGFNEADREKYHHGTWHYINKPLYLDPASELALSAKLPVNLSTSSEDGTEVLKFNVLQALEFCVKQMNDPAVSPADKAVSLCWIMHLCGDIHQPLHSTALFAKKTFPEGDRGGNLIRFKRSNLHSQWDRLLGTSWKYSDITRKAVGISHDPALKQLGKAATQKMAFETWSDESHVLAKEHAYSLQILAAVKAAEAKGTNLKKLPQLPQSYFQNGGTIASQRAAQAGWRLAAVINSVQ